jgi:hypothetical protein
MTLLNALDFIFVVVLLIFLIWEDRVRRQNVSEEAKQYLEEPQDITANAAARAIQSGITIGGFLFAGLFATLFEERLQVYGLDILIGFVWTGLAILGGLTNIAMLSTYSLALNYVATPMYIRLLHVQYGFIIGAFTRMIILVVKYYSSHQ